MGIQVIDDVTELDRLGRPLPSIPWNDPDAEVDAALAAAAPPSALTQCQREVIAYRAHGLTKKEIAIVRGCDFETVNQLAMLAYKRLGLHSAAAIVRYCVRHGLVTA